MGSGASIGRGRRSCAVAGFVLALVLLVQCGDEPDAPTYQDPALLCIPRLAADWVPTWRPPHAPDGTACTEDTIAGAYQACFARSTEESCRKFSTNANTRSCASCLFSSADASPQGPILLLPNRTWETNTPGCIALVDGPVGDSGCGARVQAANSCYETACSKCEPYPEFFKCQTQAAQTVCRSFYLDAVCMFRPSYAICIDWATNYEYFAAMARLFCRNVRPISGVDNTEKAS